jgi:hypothetical protein
MIAAAEDVLLGVLRGPVACHWFPDAQAKMVFLAMEVQHPEEHHLSDWRTLKAGPHCRDTI